MKKMSAGEQTQSAVDCAMITSFDEIMIGSSDFSRGDAEYVVTCQWSEVDVTSGYAEEHRFSTYLKVRVKLQL